VKVTTTVNGVAQPKLDQTFLWVAIDDGYSVSP